MKLALVQHDWGGAELSQASLCGGFVLKLAFTWSCVDYFCHEAKVMIMVLF